MALRALPLVGFAAFGIYRAATSTPADELEVGDCFEQLDEGDFGSVKDQSCDGFHDSEVFATVMLEPGLTPEAALADAESKCFAELEELVEHMTNLPLDGQASFVLPDDRSLEDGRREAQCLVESATGIDGPLYGTNNPFAPRTGDQGFTEYNPDTFEEDIENGAFVVVD